MNRTITLAKKIIKKIAYYALLSPLLKKTNWYKSLFLEDIYPGNIWYREHLERNFDLIALGSSGAKWAFDFSERDIKAMNWAQQPQTLVEDFNLLRNFHSILKKNGIVIITIMPFTSINKQTGIYDALKYQKIHSHEPIEPHMNNKARLITEIPLLLGKPAIKALIKYIIGKDTPSHNNSCSTLSVNPMTPEELDQNAKSFIDGWKEQFGISSFEDPLTQENQAGRKFRIQLMRKIIDFCIERSYSPVFVIPPVTKHLSKYYTPLFERTYINSFINSLGREIILLDYSKDEELKDDDLYFNSFFLNKKGRHIFTERVLSDLGFK